MFGKGLLTGMGVTIKHFFGKKETFCYPEEKLPMAEGFRGGNLTMDWRVCIACQLCAMACPNKALELKVVTDAKKKRHMEHYIHKTGRCLFCNLCVEACPVHTLKWDKDFAFSSWNKAAMTHDAVSAADRADLQKLLANIEAKAMAEAAEKAKAEAEARPAPKTRPPVSQAAPVPQRAKQQQKEKGGEV